MDPLEAFKEELQEALVHLYDPDYEPSAQIYSVLQSNPSAGPTAVQSALIQLIASLEPASNVPADNPTRQEFEVLNQRFVQRLTQAEIADQLHVSVRSVQRMQRRAIHRLARRLRERPGAGALETETVTEAQIQPAESSSDNQSQDWHSQVKQELASLRQGSQGNVADVGATIERVIKVGQILTSKRGIRLSVPPASSNFTATIHPAALRQVLITAIDKLAQHISSGEITLRTKQTENFINITIEGYPVTATRLPQSELISEILEAQGGKVEIKQDQDRIAFKLDIPSAVKKITVLVVDDNSDLVNFYQNYTSGTRYQIIHLADGKRLFETIEASPPDIIVLDVMLPEIDGWELLTYLHEYPVSRSIPVIVCSVVRREELASALGAALYLAKPVRRKQFLQALDQVAVWLN